jgi:hypothetical protein
MAYVHRNAAKVRGRHIQGAKGAAVGAPSANLWQSWIGGASSFCGFES